MKNTLERIVTCRTFLRIIFLLWITRVVPGQVAAHEQGSASNESVFTGEGGGRPFCDRFFGKRVFDAEGGGRQFCDRFSGSVSCESVFNGKSEDRRFFEIVDFAVDFLKTHIARAFLMPR